MNGVGLFDVRRTETPESATISYLFDIAGTTQEVWFRISAPAANAAAETFVALTLLPAMKLGADVALDRPVSERMLRNLGAIQDVFACWQPETFRRIAIHALPSPSQTRISNAVACFFSAGVDSFYTLLKHSDEVTTLLLVHGFDIGLENEAMSAKVSATVRRIAARLNKKVIEIHTNVRAFSASRLRWGMYHGSVLAAVGLMLAPLVSKIYIPATHTYADLLPWGSHPLVDPLWSSEQVSFVHDGCEATRVEKVAAISKSDVAMSTLRVCWRNPGGEYNCGRCDKCLRTMVNLHLASALGRCSTLPSTLELKQIARTSIRGDSSRAFAYENLRALRQRGGDPKLIDALEDALNGRYERGIWRVQEKVHRWVRRKALRDTTAQR
jgi:hypothetical protein